MLPAIGNATLCGHRRGRGAKTRGLFCFCFFCLRVGLWQVSRGLRGCSPSRAVAARLVRGSSGCKIGNFCALLASCSAQAALRKLLCGSCSAQVLPKLRDCALRTRFVLKICDFGERAAEMYSAYYFCMKICDFAAGAEGRFSAYYFCTENLRFCSWSYRNILRVLLLYLKFTTLQLNVLRVLLLCT